MGVLCLSNSPFGGSSGKTWKANDVKQSGVTSWVYVSLFWSRMNMLPMQLTSYCLIFVAICVCQPIRLDDDCMESCYKYICC
jgi:hypothetical protein